MQVLGMKIKPYVPDFTTAFEHFCIHPGGKAVIGEVGKRLKLRPEQCMPMVVPFERYGNTSSSSTWCDSSAEALLPRLLTRHTSSCQLVCQDTSKYCMVAMISKVEDIRMLSFNLTSMVQLLKP
jgi:hypothetical protein